MKKVIPRKQSSGLVRADLEDLARLNLDGCSINNDAFGRLLLEVDNLSLERLEIFCALSHKYLSACLPDYNSWLRTNNRLVGLKEQIAQLLQQHKGKLYYCNNFKDPKIQDIYLSVAKEAKLDFELDKLVQKNCNQLYPIYASGSTAKISGYKIANHGGSKGLFKLAQELLQLRAIAQQQFVFNCYAKIYVGILRQDNPVLQIKFCITASEVLSAKGYYLAEFGLTDKVHNAIEYLMDGYHTAGALLRKKEDKNLLKLQTQITNKFIAMEQGGVAQVLTSHFSSSFGALYREFEIAIEGDSLDIKLIDKVLRSINAVSCNNTLNSNSVMRSVLRDFIKLLKHPNTAELYNKCWGTIFYKAYAVDISQVSVLQQQVLSHLQIWQGYDLKSAKKCLSLYHTALKKAHSKLTRRLTQDNKYQVKHQQSAVLLETVEVMLAGISTNCGNEIKVKRETVKLNNNYKQYRVKVNAMIKSVGGMLQQNNPITDIQVTNTKAAQAIVGGIFSEVEQLLGAAPCAFSILGLGSYSRGEISLCSDIDMAVLIEDGAYKHDAYFKNLIRLVSYKVQFLPENTLEIENKDLGEILGKINPMLNTPQGMVDVHLPSAIEDGQRDMVTNTGSYSARRADAVYCSNADNTKAKQLLEHYNKLLEERLYCKTNGVPYYKRIAALCFAEDFKSNSGAELISLNLNEQQDKGPTTYRAESFAHRCKLLIYK